MHDLDLESVVNKATSIEGGRVLEPWVGHKALKFPHLVL